MAELLFSREADGRHLARSAGTRPSGTPSPLVAEVMREVGIELGQRTGRKLERADIEWADLVVIAGTTGGVPDLDGKARTEWDLPRIKGRPVEAMRRAREEIDERAKALVAALDRNS